MTNNQENKLSMFETVLELFNNNPAIVALILAFANAATTFTNKIGLLQQQVALQTAIITGVAKAKRTRKTTLIDQMLVVIGALRAYAKETNDDELFNFVNYKRYKLNKQADTVLAQLAINIKDKANSLIASLSDYGITPALMGTFNLAISDYALFVPKPRSARVNKKTVTKNIKDIIKEIDGILLDELDALAIQFKTTQADFYNDYLSARMVIDLGHHFKPLVVKGSVNSGQVFNVFSTDNSEWKPGVKITIKNTTSGPGVNSMYFYTANNLGDGYSGQGSLLTSGQEETHTLTAAEFKPFLNIQNQSPNSGTFEVVIL